MILILGSIGILSRQVEPEEPVVIKELGDLDKDKMEFDYYKVSIRQDSIFSYRLTLNAERELSMTMIDQSENGRNRNANATLSLDEVAKLITNIESRKLNRLSPQYIDNAENETDIDMRTLTVTIGRDIYESKVMYNAPAADFMMIAEFLEEITKEKLGIWGADMSVAELLQLATESFDRAKRYDQEQVLNEHYLYEAIMAYKQAISIAQEITPKPQFLDNARMSLDFAEQDLTERYQSLRFTATQARNTKQYDKAQDALKAILRIIPNRDDSRYIATQQELLSINNIMSKRR